MRKTLSRAVLLLSLTVALVPGPADATASCSGNPCAETECSMTGASAAANGNEYSHSVATAGGVTSREVAPDGGATSAAVSGGLPVEADAKGKKDWSLAQDSEKCSIKAGAQFVAALLSDDPGGVGRSELASLPGAGDLSVACAADGRVRGTQHFLGRVYVGDDGSLVLADPVTGRGLALGGFTLRFDSTSLAALVPVDVTALAPTNGVVALDVVNDARSSSCAVALYV